MAGTTGRTTHCHAHADMCGAYQPPCHDACLLCCALPSCLQFQASPQLAITFIDTPPFIREYHKKHWANLVGGWYGLPFPHSVFPAWALRQAYPAAFVVAPHAAAATGHAALVLGHIVCGLQPWAEGGQGVLCRVLRSSIENSLVLQAAQGPRQEQLSKLYCA